MNKDDMTLRHQDLQSALRALGDPDIAAQSQRFFKTAKGEYGEGDVFIGVRVPVIRAQAKVFAALDLKEALALLRSDVHEERLCALVILVQQFNKGTDDIQRSIYHEYLKHSKYVSGWDLVDLSAHPIVGGYLLKRDREKLTELAQSKMLWQRRIAIIATLHFIKRAQLDDTFRLADILLNDSEDLIHKAVGWMLREAGKHKQGRLNAFLRQRYQRMPRTMLRYAIEKLSEEQRKAYLTGTV